MERPHRRFVLTITIGGDEWKDIIREVRDLLPHIEDHGTVCTSVSGGDSSGHTVQIVEDREMTHDRYFELVDQYIRQTKATCAGGCGATKDELIAIGHRAGCKLASCDR